MTKVLLVNPNTEKSPYPVAPIGLCLLAASLGERHEVRLFDATFGGPAGLKETLRDFAPSYIGIGIRNIDDVTLGNEHYYIDEIKRDFVDAIREETEAPIILGGSGFNLFPGHLLDALEADFGIVGEGEVSFPALIDALESSGDPRAIQGVMTALDPPGHAVLPARSSGLLDIPFASVDTFVDFTPYRARGTYPIQTKRGCHLTCAYCAYPIIEGRNYRLRTPKAIVDEIEAAKERLGDVVFELVDSTFNAPQAHAEAICSEIIARRLDVKLRSMGVNPGGISDRLLTLMLRAGFVQIVCSADTASSVMLENLGKGFTRERLEAAAELLTEHDMPTMWSFIFGGPGETKETIEESFDFITRFVNELDMVHMTEGIRIYPGTPIYHRAVTEGLIAGDDPILRPVFYVAPALGRERLAEIVTGKSDAHFNCIRNIDSSPDPALVKEAMALRTEHHLDEPMFRTFLRVRKLRQGQT